MNTTATQPRSALALAARWLVSVHFAALATQIGAAIWLAAGHGEAFRLHSANAWLVTALGAVQGIALLLCGLARLGRLYLLLAISLPFLEAMQIGLGQSAQLVAHGSQGLAIWGIGLALLIKVWRPDWVLDEAGR
jgi:hypothetical protein